LVPPSLLAACPQLQHLTLDECAVAKPTPGKAAAIITTSSSGAVTPHANLHTLNLISPAQLWTSQPATGLADLPSLHTLLLGEVRGLTDAACRTIAVVASQLTRLRLECGADDTSDIYQHILQPLLAHCSAGLSQQLQRLELPKACLCDEGIEALCGQLPALSVAEVKTLELLDNRSGMACNWQELVTTGFVPIEFLAHLPLARAGRQGGVQKLSLTRVACLESNPFLSTGIATVCGSTCQISAVPDGDGLRFLCMSCCDADGMHTLTQLLRRFEPDSVEGLGLMLTSSSHGENEDLRVQALAAFAAEMAAGHAALNKCKRLVLDDMDNNWYTPAACAVLLPTLMPSKVDLIFLQKLSPIAAAAVCSPDALAAVTRPMAIGVCSDVDVAGMQAAITAAGKGHLLVVKCFN
jgi:hypothetical protein